MRSDDLAPPGEKRRYMRRLKPLRLRVAEGIRQRQLPKIAAGQASIVGGGAGGTKSRFSITLFAKFRFNRSRQAASLERHGTQSRGAAAMSGLTTSAGALARYSLADTRFALIDADAAGRRRAMSAGHEAGSLLED
jgi:hypothetical protein